MAMHDSIIVRNMEVEAVSLATIGYPPGKPKQTRVRVAADGYHIVTADGVWDMFSRTLIHPIDFRTEKDGGEILSSQPFEALPDGRQYLKVNMGQLQLYDTLTKTWDTLSERQIYNQYWSALTSDGKKLITAGENGTILFWDLSKVITGIEERELEYGNECRCLAYPQPSYSSKVTFAIDIGEPTVMQIEIVDIFGQVVHKGEIERGGIRKFYEWNTLNTAGEQVRSGVYFVQITTEKGGMCSSKLMIGR
jgi:WD40 repeat protein